MNQGGVMLTRVMSEQFNVGVIKDGSYVRTDIHTASLPERRILAINICRSFVTE